jgi:hypothetical protein
MSGSGAPGLLKKLLRRTTYVLGAVVVLVGVLAAYVQVDGIPTFPHETPVFDGRANPGAARAGQAAGVAALQRVSLEQ